MLQDWHTPQAPPSRPRNGSLSRPPRGAFAGSPGLFVAPIGSELVVRIPALGPTGVLVVLLDRRDVLGRRPLDPVGAPLAEGGAAEVPGQRARPPTADQADQTQDQ